MYKTLPDDWSEVLFILLLCHENQSSLIMFELLLEDDLKYNVLRVEKLWTNSKSLELSYCHYLWIY